VRSVDWDVDERLGPAERDWVKAAMFAWRMLVQDRLARPERDRVADFDDRTGGILGASIVELHEFPGVDAADQLLESLYGALSYESERGLIDVAVETGFAREVLRFQDFAEMTSELRAAAESQVELEERVEQSTGLQRRLLLRGLRERGQASFHLDILPGAIAAAPPRSAEELQRLVLAAEFDSLLDNFLDGQLTAFENHPWRDRAIQHALVMEPGPDIEIGDIQGIVTARFQWPPGELVELARLRIASGGQVIDERMIERQRDHSSVRIRGIGSGFPEGQRLDVSIAFCVQGEDGGVIECPQAASATVIAPAAPVRPVIRTPRAIREAERRSSLPGEAALDVARPDPNAPRERRRRRRRRVTGGAILALLALTMILWDGSAEVRLDAVATTNEDSTEIVWAVRSDAESPATVERFTIQRRILGPIWIGQGHTGDEGRIASGSTVRVTTSEAATLRVRAELVGRGVVRSAPLTALRPESGARLAPESTLMLSWVPLDDGRGLLSWSLPQPTELRIVDRVQVLVLDSRGDRILRTSTGDLGLFIESSVINAAPSGLDIRVRVITSDGMRSDWATVLTEPVSIARLPRPTGLEVIGSGTDLAAVRWSYPSSTGSSGPERFEVVVGDVRRSEPRSLEVDSSRISLQDVFAGEEVDVLVLRVRAILPDGTRGALSSAITVRDTQIGSGS